MPPAGRQASQISPRVTPSRTASTMSGIRLRSSTDAAYRYQQEVEAEERIVVGVNKYLTGSDEQVDILRIDPDLERKQIERLQAFKARRDSAVVERRVAELSEAASLPYRNLRPVIVDAVRAGVTLGEICDAWRPAGGTWREPPVF